MSRQALSLSLLLSAFLCLPACAGDTYGCAQEELDEGSCVIACETEEDCPLDWVCRDTLARCLHPDFADQFPPVVAIWPIARTHGSVEIPLIVTDANDDAVTLTVTYSPDSGSAFLPATLAGAAETVAATADGVLESLYWEAATDLGGTGFVTDLLIQVEPADDSSVGTAVVSAPFDFGNDAPALTAVNIGSAVVTGNTTIELQASDSAGDDVEIASVELSLLGDFTDATAIPIDATHFPVGALTGIGTTSTGGSHLITWDTTVAAPVDAVGARLRVALVDAFGDSSATVESAPFELDNLP